MIHLVCWDKYSSLDGKIRDGINIRNRYVICTFPREPVKDLTFIMSYQELPGSFDALWQIQNMLIIARQALKAENVYLLIENVYQHKKKEGQGHDEFLENVTRPLLKMFGIVETSRPIGHCIVGQIPYNAAPSVGLYNENGVFPYRWKVSQEAQNWASQYIGSVVFTLRQCAHYDFRNSMTVEWIRAARTLKGYGERVVFVPDTASLEPYVGGFECIKEAAIDVEKRAALYAVARANMFISNGPHTLCYCMPEIPYVTLIPKMAVEQQEILNTGFNSMFWGDFDHTTQWKAWLGVEKGSSGPPFRGPQQLWMWEEDTYDAIMRGYRFIIDNETQGKRVAVG